MGATRLGLPPALLAQDRHFPVTKVDPVHLTRVSRFSTGEPFFGASGAHRFDAPGCRRGQAEYRSCYLGFNLGVAIAESLLHDAVPVDGQFPIAASTLRGHFVHRIKGEPLRLLELTGALLKRLDGHADLAGTSDYPITQQWAFAVFQNPLNFDGFVYMSRHMNTGRAVVVFDRAADKLTALPDAVELCDAPGFAALAASFRIVPA